MFERFEVLEILLLLLSLLDLLELFGDFFISGKEDNACFDAVVVEDDDADTQNKNKITKMVSIFRSL